MDRLTRLWIWIDGTAIGRFTIAYNHRFRKGEEWVDEPHFFDVKVFGRLAQKVGERYHKGDLVFVEGRLSQDRWETEEGKRSRITIVADTVRLVKTKGESITVEDEEEGDEDPGVEL